MSKIIIQYNSPSNFSPYLLSLEDGSTVIEGQLSSILSKFARCYSYRINDRVVSLVNEVAKDLNPVQVYAKLNKELQLQVFLFINNLKYDEKKKTIYAINISKFLEEKLKTDNIHLPIEVFIFKEDDLTEMVGIFHSLKKTLLELKDLLLNSINNKRPDKISFFENFFSEDLNQVVNYLKKI